MRRALLAVLLVPTLLSAGPGRASAAGWRTVFRATRPARGFEQTEHVKLQASGARQRLQFTVQGYRNSRRQEAIRGAVRSGQHQVLVSWKRPSGGYWGAVTPEPSVYVIASASGSRTRPRQLARWYPVSYGSTDLALKVMAKEPLAVIPSPQRGGVEKVIVLPGKRAPLVYHLQVNDGGQWVAKRLTARPKAASPYRFDVEP